MVKIGIKNNKYSHTIIKRIYEDKLGTPSF